MERDESSTLPAFLLQYVGVIAIIGLLVVGGLLYDWAAYNWSTRDDTAASYEAYLKANSHSKYSEEARERLRVLSEDSRWEEAKRSNDPSWIDRYIQVYPNGKHLKDARAQLHALAEKSWAQMGADTTEGEYEKFMSDYFNTPLAENANERLAKLRSDGEWVGTYGGLETCRKFLEKNPDSPHVEQVERRIIDLEVKEVATGEYLPLPPITSESTVEGAADTAILIENDTGYELTIRYSGPGSTKVILANDESRSLTLPVGEYRISASVNSSNVLPYYGTNTFQGGTASSRFIVTSSRHRR